MNLFNDPRSTIQFHRPAVSFEKRSIQMTDGSISAAGESFSASRWTRGNHIFPTRIVVSPLHVSRVKPRLFSQTEESIAISQVASVQITTGILWSEIRIDSTGGADPITSHGHRKRDAIRIRELIESYQAGARGTMAGSTQ
jgi:hypothetical protein